MSQVRKLRLMCIIMSLFVSVSSMATMYYVAPNGSNDANGLTLQTPWLTIQKAANAMIAGDTVYVRGGTYREKLWIATGQNNSDYITFRPYKDENVIIIPGLNCNNWTVNDPDQSVYKLDISSLPEITQTATIGLIKKDGDGTYDGYGISRVDKYSDLTDPNYIGIGQIAENLDLFYYAPNDNSIYARLVSTNPCINPNDIFIVDATRRICIVSPNIEIIGFSIKYGYEGLKVTWTKNINDPNCRGDYVKIINNEIKHSYRHGILSGQNDLLIHGNYISYIGRPLKYYQDHLQDNNLDHAMYLSWRCQS